MSLHAIDALVPDDLDRWRIETRTIVGRTMSTARFYGVTFTFVLDEDRWWTVTKIHGGKIQAQYVTRKLPSRVQEFVDSGRSRRSIAA